MAWEGTSLAVDVMLSCLLSVVREYSRRGGDEAYHSELKLSQQKPAMWYEEWEGDRRNNKYGQDLSCSLLK
jgi:hypothetical protein